MDDLMSEFERNRKLFRQGKSKRFDDDNDENSDGTDRHGWAKEKPVRRKPPHKIGFGGSCG